MCKGVLACDSEITNWSASANYVKIYVPQQSNASYGTKTCLSKIVVQCLSICITSINTAYSVSYSIVNWVCKLASAGQANLMVMHNGDKGYATGDKGYAIGDKGYATGDKGYATGDKGYE